MAYREDPNQTRKQWADREFERWAKDLEKRRRRARRGPLVLALGVGVAVGAILALVATLSG